MDAAMCRWKSSALGYYHNTHCVSVALSVWIRHTHALSANFVILIHKTVLVTLATFVAFWKQVLKKD